MRLSIFIKQKQVKCILKSYCLSTVHQPTTHKLPTNDYFTSATHTSPLLCGELWKWGCVTTLLSPSTCWLCAGLQTASWNLTFWVVVWAGSCLPWSYWDRRERASSDTLTQANTIRTNPQRNTPFRVCNQTVLTWVELGADSSLVPALSVHFCVSLCAESGYMKYSKFTSYWSSVFEGTGSAFVLQATSCSSLPDLGCSHRGGPGGGTAATGLAVTPGWGGGEMPVKPSLNPNHEHRGLAVLAV